jgi:hypothetical protein
MGGGYFDKLEIWGKANPINAGIGVFVIWVLSLIILYFGVTFCVAQFTNNKATIDGHDNPSKNLPKAYGFGFVGLILGILGIVIALLGFLLGLTLIFS